MGWKGYVITSYSIHYTKLYDDTGMLLQLFDMFEKECIRLAAIPLVFPAYDFVLKCSHSFNMLDARGAISVTERASYIGRVRNVARLCAEGYVAQREKLRNNFV